MVSLDLGGERLWLLPQRAAFLPSRRMLLVADAHVGKAMSFRRLGVPVPGGTTTDTLQRLGELVDRHQAQEVVFLGDLLHSAHAHAAPTLAAFLRWREARPRLRMTLVRGNHDRNAGDPPPELGIDSVGEPLQLGGLVLQHHPRRAQAGYVLAGHLHPCVHLGQGFERLRLPCFHLGPSVGVLPAFGAFTGMHAVRPAPGDRVFVVADEVVRALPWEARDAA